MTVFLTSSPTGPLDNSRSVYGVDEMNSFVQQLHWRWPANARCLMISAAPADDDFNNMVQHTMRASFERSGFTFSCFDSWDNRTTDFSAEALHSYDVVMLGGGHVPTQNAFFCRIGLRETIRHFHGIVIGISAGTMNSADVVYAQPELEGESIAPNYDRFLSGLALTKTNLLPHYQMVKDSWLDGRRLFEDITYPDSIGRCFLALTDGSFLLCENGRETLFGEAYRLTDGRMSLICSTDKSILWSE